MPAPTTRFKAQANTPATTALDTASERKTYQGANGTTVDDTGSNPWDFGTVSIAGAVAPVRSTVKHLMWDVSAWGPNVAVSNFRAWFDSNPEGWGFDNAGTQLKYKALRYQSGSNGTAYVQNADETSYGGHATWSVAAHQDSPPAQNLYAGDGDTGFGTGDDDVVGMQALLEVDELETAGVYLGDTSGYEFQMSLRYDYN